MAEIICGVRGGKKNRGGDESERYALWVVVETKVDRT